jgi:hypothetical protein
MVNVYQNQERVRRARRFAIIISSLLILIFIIGHVFGAPNITSVTPNSGPSTGGTNIVIAGSGFADYTIASGVDFAFNTSSCRFTETIPNKR